MKCIKFIVIIKTYFDAFIFKDCVQKYHFQRISFRGNLVYNFLKLSYYIL